MNIASEYSSSIAIWKIHISFIIRDQWWVYIGFLHISTRSIEWRNETQENAWFIFHQFLPVFMGIRLTKIGENGRKMNLAFSWISLRHSIDLVEIWRKLIYTAHWSRIRRKIWIFEYRVRVLVVDRDLKNSYLFYYSRSMMSIYRFSPYLDEVYRMAQWNPRKCLVHFSSIFASFHGH